MKAITLKKNYGIELGKTYTCGNDEIIIIKGIGRRVYDRTVLLSCEVTKCGVTKMCDVSLNSVSGWKGWQTPSVV